ncbi:Holliday junction resolvase [Arthrobacter phage Jasmine]|uniref:RuvC-like resolvase n=1 Tax=Arthrobacter phage Jasmine TaxID=1772302 RepID=A0A0U4ILA4_9CAUD|nr:Holliday junction resolvase [Arthrobacter phage Jasmine]ALY09306.1 RuvC-like resolvase [Arthrobacter phage Jasmine]USL89115.1 RuvC-like resolvase [Arthrobacter phage Casserole]
MRVLSFDPGGTTGWAYQSEQVDPTDTTKFAYGDVVTKRLTEFLMAWPLDKNPVDVVVVEAYRIRETKRDLSANVGIKIVTAENIGRIEFWCEMHGIEYVEYETKEKPTIWKATGVKVDKSVPKAISHMLDAWNIGRWHMIKLRIAPTLLEIRMRQNGEL